MTLFFLPMFFTTRRELQQVLFLAPSVCSFLFAYEIAWELLNGFVPKFTRKTCLVPCLEQLERQDHGSRYVGKQEYRGALKMPGIYIVTVNVVTNSDESYQMRGDCIN